MATVIKRKRKDGAFAYRADIRIKNNGVIVHQVSSTFDLQVLATTWGTKREIELQGLDIYGAKKSVLINTLIADYVDSFNGAYSRSKQADVRRRLNYYLADFLNLG